MEVEFQPFDQIDDSNMVENDVKVCDICGDCGQEDSLATCCRCSDGAEHIYCMREMLVTVPSGDWMCEECEYMELVTNERPQNIGRVDESESNNSTGQESSGIINNYDIEGQRTRGCMRTPGNRLGDDADANVSSIEKGTSSSQHCSSLETEHPLINSMNETSWSSTPIIDKKPTSSCGSSSFTTFTNHHELKPVPNDHKSAAASQPSSLSSQNNAELSSSLGEFKRPTSHGHSTLGVLANPKEEDISFSIVSETPPLSEGLPNGLSQSNDSTNSGVGTIEYSGNHFQPPTVKSSNDEGDILKAAIEAALLRKPGLCQKRRALCQPDSSFISTVTCGKASCQDHVSISIGKKNLRDEVLKQETLSKANLIPLLPAKGLYSGGGGAVPIVPSDEKSSLRETLKNIQAAMPVFMKTLTIPAHEYIWRGSFEICRSGRLFDSWDGIQAHLSRHASPKVMEAVNKFKSRIILYEVPRLSTWPLQFQEHGVTEDNVALFFFAKDVESYEKIYKLLLDNMMMNDLALKGNFNGVELLIFPSNQLPDNSQRWNTLFFLWGVFRGEKDSCSQHMPEPLGQFKSSQDMPPAILSIPQSRCSLGPITDQFPVSQHAAPAPEVLDAADGGLISSPTVAVPSDNAKQCQGLSTMSLEGGITSSCKTPSTG